MDISFMYEDRRLVDGKTLGLKYYYYKLNNLFREAINLEGGDSTVIHEFAKNLARIAPGSDGLSFSMFIWFMLSLALDDGRNIFPYAAYISFLIESVCCGFQEIDDS